MKPTITFPVGIAPLSDGEGDGRSAGEISGRRPKGGAASPVADDRYEDLGLIAEGGFGEVRRVRDRKLERVVAAKILHAGPGAGAAAKERLVREAKLGARLQHPGIVSVYDYGESPDGRVWITMPEVRGRTLTRVLAAGDAPDTGHAAPGLRRVLEVLARVCQAVAFAHRNGVVHRDLKPDNILVGDLGEVLVVDWGLALDLTQPIAEGEPAAAVIGTPAYMAPEQARGEVSSHGPAVDVYALGATLYQVLTGRAPYAGSPRRVIAGVIAGPPASPGSFPGVPPDLARVCERAMARAPEDRYPSAEALATALLDWLDDMTRRDRALAALPPNLPVAGGGAGDSLPVAGGGAGDSLPVAGGGAGESLPVAGAGSADEAALRERALAMLSAIPPHAPVEAKAAAWELLDEADRAAKRRREREAAWVTAVHGALAIDPALPEAHAALADHYREALLSAELSDREDDAARFEALLRVHDRGRHATLLAGLGRVSLHSDPPGARVTLHRYEPHRRRLVPGPGQPIGVTPILDREVPHGSHLAVLSLEGHRDVRYPLRVRRGEAWDGVPPGGGPPSPVVLPAIGELDDGEELVPGGWAWTGGDSDAPDSLPGRRVWVDTFVIDRFPVTNAQYLIFLNTLLAAGREEEAIAACPRVNLGAGPDAEDRLALSREPGGPFTQPVSDAVLQWHPESPVTLVSWRAARAYAAWRAETTGRPYRLPHELEREKAARGADGRPYPWGAAFDPSWACMLDSHAGDPGRVAVHAYPLDESPYGVRGLAGNSRDLCANVWRREGPKIAGGRLVLEEEGPPASHDHVVVRGGAWSSVANHCRASARFGLRPDHRRSSTGIRLVRSFAPVGRGAPPRS